MPAQKYTMTAIRQIFLTECELARRSNLPLSALKRILRADRINPVAVTAEGRIRLYPETLVGEIRKTTTTK
jgi:predicted transcriptional regulator